MERVVKKIGKPAMPRSQKKAIKKKVVKQVQDEEEINWMKYVGEEKPQPGQVGPPAHSGI